MTDLLNWKEKGGGGGGGVPKHPKHRLTQLDGKYM